VVKGKQRTGDGVTAAPEDAEDDNCRSKHHDTKSVEHDVHVNRIKVRLHRVKTTNSQIHPEWLDQLLLTSLAITVSFISLRSYFSVVQSATTCVYAVRTVQTSNTKTICIKDKKTGKQQLYCAHNEIYTCAIKLQRNCNKTVYFVLIQL